MKIFTLVLFSIIMMGRGEASMKLDYGELEKIVKERNKKVSASVIEMQGYQGREGYLGRSFIPTGEAALAHEKYRTGNYGTMDDPMYLLRADLNLYRGGRDSLEETSRIAQTRERKIHASQVYQDELLEARVLFWDLVFFREVKGIYDKTLEMNKRNLSGALKRINAGLTTRVDKLEFEISEIQLSQDVARLQVSIATTQRRLAAVLALAAETEFDTVDVISHQHEFDPRSLAIDVSNFRDVQMEMTSNSELDAKGKQLKRWWTPSLDLYAESILYNFRERTFAAQDNRVDNALGIKLSFSFDGFQMQKDGESLIAQATAARLRADQIKTETEASFNTAKQELALLHDLIHEGEKNVEKGEDYLSVTVSEYSRGVKNSVDVLSATLKQLEFKKRFAQLRRDYAVAKARAESLMNN